MFGVQKLSVAYPPFSEVWKVGEVPRSPGAPTSQNRVQCDALPLLRAAGFGPAWLSVPNS
jgi:hypothetical protein